MGNFDAFDAPLFGAGLLFYSVLYKTFVTLGKSGVFSRLHRDDIREIAMRWVFFYCRSVRIYVDTAVPVYHIYRQRPSYGENTHSKLWERWATKRCFTKYNIIDKKLVKTSEIQNLCLLHKTWHTNIRSSFLYSSEYHAKNLKDFRRQKGWKKESLLFDSNRG